MPADTRVYDACKRILDAIVAGFAAAGVALPSVQYVSAGRCAFDCEQVVIEATGFFHGFPAQPATGITKCEIPRHVGVRAVIVRCTKCIPSENGDPPSAADCDDSAQAFLVDAWHLLDSVYAAYRAGDLERPPGCTLAAIGACDVLEASGAFGAVGLNLELQV